MYCCEIKYKSICLSHHLAWHELSSFKDHEFAYHRCLSSCLLSLQCLSQSSPFLSRPRPSYDPPCRVRVLRPGILIHLEVMTHLIDDPVDFHFLRTAVVSCSLVDREIIASTFHLRQFWVHVACQPRNRVSNARLVDKVVLDHLILRGHYVMRS